MTTPTYEAILVAAHQALAVHAIVPASRVHLETEDGFDRSGCPALNVRPVEDAEPTADGRQCELVFGVETVTFDADTSRTDRAAILAETHRLLLTNRSLGMPNVHVRRGPIRWEAADADGIPRRCTQLFIASYRSTEIAQL